MSTTTSSTDYSRITISGFLGFPHQASPRPIEIDGDIVLLSGANGAGKSSLLEALALTETGQNYRPPAHWIHRSEHASDTFSIQVGDHTLTGQKNGSIDEFPAWWQPEEVDRKRHLRPVYFHPQYLDKLFEENPPEPGTSFVDLIAPTPQAVVNLNKALSATLPAVDAQISRLEQEGGFISEAEQKDQRRQLIHAFKESIKSWKELNPATSEWLEKPTEYSLVLKEGNRSNSWSSQLNNITKKALKKLGDLAPDLSVSSPPNQPKPSAPWPKPPASPPPVSKFPLPQIPTPKTTPPPSSRPRQPTPSPHHRTVVPTETLPNRRQNRRLHRRFLRKTAGRTTRRRPPSPQRTRPR